MDGTALHVMDHAWEMEDQDLGEPSAPRAGARPSAAGEGDDQQAAFIEADDLSVVRDGAVPAHQADPIADGTTLDGFVAADDQGAKETVMELVRSIGLNPVDVGPLARAQQLEQMAFLNIALNVTANGSWTSGWKLVGAPTLEPIAA